jgi:hypothetical protein
VKYFLDIIKTFKFRKQFCKVDFNSVELDVSGVPLYQNKKFVWVDNQKSNSIVLAGSGRTVSVIKPQLQLLSRAKESIVIFTRDNDLYEQTVNSFMEKGYNCILYDVREIDGEISSSINFKSNCQLLIKEPTIIYVVGNLEYESNIRKKYDILTMFESELGQLEYVKGRRVNIIVSEFEIYDKLIIPKANLNVRYTFLSSSWKHIKTRNEKEWEEFLKTIQHGLYMSSYQGFHVFEWEGKLKPYIKKYKQHYGDINTVVYFDLNNAENEPIESKFKVLVELK